MSKVKFTDSNGQDQVEEMVVLGGTTTADGSSAGLVVAEIQQPAGIVEYADVFFNAATDMPDYAELISGIPIADLVRVTGFTAGKKRCRVTYHALEDLGIPFAIGARVALNSADSTDAADKLKIIDNSGGDTVSPIEGAVPQTISKRNTVCQWDLSDTEFDVDDVFLVGIAPDGIGASDVLVTVEVW